MDTPRRLRQVGLAAALLVAFAGLGCARGGDVAPQPAASPPPSAPAPQPPPTQAAPRATPSGPGPAAPAATQAAPAGSASSAGATDSPRSPLDDAPSDAPATAQATAPKPPPAAGANAADDAPDPPATDPVWRGAKWLGVFAAYPGVRRLCAEHVTENNMHISWQSYATRDAPEKVVAFYKRAHPSRVGLGQGELSLDAPEDKSLSVHRADDQYPRCSVQPGPGEKTVILVAQAAR